MAYQRLSKSKRALVLSALCEGTPINAVARMFGVGKNSIARVIEETGEALSHYMRENFRDLPCKRIELDEQWQYVGKHGQRMQKKERERCDFWLWAAIDADTKIVFSFLVARRDWQASEDFVEDVSKRVRKPVQIATDQHRSYAKHIRAFFGYEGYSYGTETKIFGEPGRFNPDGWPESRKNGIPPIVTSEREAVIGSPDLGSLTTSHIERVFLSVRQQLTRFTRSTLGYSKNLRMHKLSVALYLGIYNLVRKHKTLGTTPAVAACIDEKPWALEDVVEMTDAYWQPKYEAQKQAAALAKRGVEDEIFFAALKIRKTIT